MYQTPPSAYEPEPEPPYAQQAMIELAFLQPRVIVTWVLLALNIAMFVLTMLSGFSIMGGSDGDVLVLIDFGAKFTPLIDLDGEWWRLGTAMVLHGGLIHLGFNSYALYLLGPEVERLYGSVRFIVIYLVSGLIGSGASYVFGAIEAPSIGASGAIFGLMGALGAFSYRSLKILGPLAKQNLRQVVGLAMINLFIGFSLSGIDNNAHLGGLIGGALLGLGLAPKLGIASRWPVTRIVGYPSKVLGWIIALGLMLSLAAVLMVVHTQRLADPETSAFMEAYRAAYYRER